MRARISARLLNCADRVAGVSVTCQERYLPYLKVPTTTIYNCCPPVKTEELKPEFLRSQQLPEETILVGSFGRITRMKGYQVLLDAVAKLDTKVGSRTAIVIGGHPLDDEESAMLAKLKQQAENLGLQNRCFFIGEVKPERFFSLIDIFCHTYLGEENLSYAILEAMSANCPIIAVDLGAPREMIDDPRSGQLIAPNNSELLAKAILKYIEDPQYAKSAAENGLQRTRTIFNFDEWPNRWLNLIKSCISATDLNQDLHLD